MEASSVEQADDEVLDIESLDEPVGKQDDAQRDEDEDETVDEVPAKRPKV